MTKLADYGVVLLTHIASSSTDVLHNAKELAQRSRIPLPMVTKILKLLAKAGLLASHRGTKGGYSLARPAQSITMADVITALDGPIALAACVVGPQGDCEHLAVCPVTGHVRRISEAIRDALSGIALSELSQPIEPLSQLIAIS